MLDEQTIRAALVRIQELVGRGQFQAAESACRAFVEDSPNVGQAWAILGLLAVERNSPAEAETALQRSLALVPRQPVVWQQLGTVLMMLGRAKEALEAFRQAISLDPQSALAWRDFGVAEQKLGRLPEAKDAYERSLAIDPSDSLTLSSYALLLAMGGEAEQAVQILREVLAREPGLAHAWFAAGNAHLVLGNLADAETRLQRALTLSPQHEGAWQNLAIVQERQSEFRKAEHSLRQLIGIRPDNAEAWAMLGRMQRALLMPGDSLQSLRHAVALSPDSSRYSKLLVGLQYADDASPESLLKAHREWDATYARHLQPASASPYVVQQRDPVRPLRLGFVSADFARHPTGYMVLPILECLDKTKCSVVCYSDRAAEDEYTARFRATSDAWRNTNDLTNDELAWQIQQDEVDILIDLMGHFGRRMLTFARQPAAVQVTWYGYVGTTGLAAMDFLLTDRFRVRESEETWFQEQVLRLPHDNACYQAPAEAPDVGPLPGLAAGHVTFGSFNNPAKYSAHTLDAWAAVLQRVPTAQLLLIYSGLDDPEVQTGLRAQFAKRGVAPARILLEGRVPHAQLLANYNRVDLALDTQPFAGDLTTCEALWMGVPVVTYPGKTLAGRHSVSHMHNVGLSQFVATAAADVIELAANWAGRLDELAILRGQLRERMRQSPLCDAPGFARDFLAVLSQAWTEHSTKRFLRSSTVPR